MSAAGRPRVLDDDKKASVCSLVAAGVEYNHVDYIGLCKQFYDGASGRVVISCARIA